MAFLHVVRGPQSGASIELENNTNYKISSDLNNSDVYLSSEVIYSFDVLINDLGVIFNNISGVEPKTATNEPLQPGKLYMFDFDLIFLGHKITFNEKNQIISKLSNRANNDFLDSIDINEKDENTEKVIPQYSTLQKIVTLSGTTLGFLFSKYISLKKRLGKLFYLVLGLVGFCIFMIIISAFLIHKEHQNNLFAKAQMNLIESKHQIQKMILALPADTYGSITVSYEKNHFVIKGVLPNNAALKYLKKYLHPIKNVAIIYHILLFSEIKDVTLAVCKENNLMNPSVNINDNFGFTLSILGIINSVDDINNAEIELHGKFNDLQQIDTSKVYLVSDLQSYWGSLPDLIRQQVTINYDFAAGIISLSGVLSKDELVTVQQYIKAFNTKYAPVIKVVSTVKDVVNTLPFSIKEVFIGSNISWLVTNDGGVIYEGGSYKGVTVLSITTKNIKFRTSFIFTVPVNELMAEENPHNNGHNIASDVGCGRDCVINQEFIKESDILAREKTQLVELHKIIGSTKDSGLKSSLSDTINNLRTDIETREHEMNYYQQENQK